MTHHAPHTPGLVSVMKGGLVRLVPRYDPEVAIADLRLRGVHTGTAHDVARAEAIANAYRLAACWNLCDGVPTEVLETLPRGALAVQGYDRAG
ncbi:hypothetical protein [Rhodospira trueperi]|uniref:Uncharacterized protein n=1 Tax=Rhodospira trueperi TaxID=69960 RepID=A0A1G7D3P7_9PROT|nr:hypothetical protein [Rhodospira trueperi]SDE46137.1 hypothetical protein SAMN05421720_10721 [Rhodospira trueperi]